MPTYIDLVGKRYGKLTVQKKAGRKKPGKFLWECLCDCGVTKIVSGESLRSGTSSCGCSRKVPCPQKGKSLYGENSINRKAGKYYVKDGYIMLTGMRGYPNANKKGYVLEHVKVMADMLGRPLQPGENVHHKNGVRDDNRLENLELWSIKQPPGQRIDDCIPFWVAQLKQYAPEYLNPNLFPYLEKVEYEYASY